MGLFREPGSQEIDIIKEMAEALGSTGSRVEDTLEKVSLARERVMALLRLYHSRDAGTDRPDASAVNDEIRAYNALVDKAQDALRWLLIHREACGFRLHGNVHAHYPVPPKMKLVKS